MRCKYCGRRLKTLFYYTTKPKYKKNNTKFAYCENCDRVFRITVAEVNYPSLRGRGLPSGDNDAINPHKTRRAG